MSPAERTPGEAIERLERRLERAVAAGLPALAGELGFVLGVLMERSRDPGMPDRLARAVRLLERADELEVPIAVRDAWLGGGG